MIENEEINENTVDEKEHPLVTDKRFLVLSYFPPFFEITPTIFIED